jgi:ATP-binding cassette subfamily F protein 3
MISVDNISKSYGSQELFSNASFKLNARERVGLVGRNGHGKTTLFRLIAGEEEPDSGAITIPKGYSIGYVVQEPDFSQPSVLEEGCLGLAAAERTHHWKVEKILAGLGFAEVDMRKHPSELSGGYQVRLNLAKALVREVNLLLLDEPSNYLDITSIRWLERYLNGWRHELMLITHDRSFMDSVVTHVIGIHRTSLRKIKGDTGKLYERIARDEELHEKKRLNDEKKRRQAEEFIRRFRAKATLASRVQSRVKALEKQLTLEKLEETKDLDFSFQSKPFNGKPLLHVRDLTFGYEPGRPLFSKLTFSVGPHDRLCVVGRNGKGKTTLLRALAGELEPLAGEVRYNATAATAYYAQSNAGRLVGHRTVVEEIYGSSPGIDQQRARNIAGLMMFEGDAALKKVRVLSGGEKNRLMLAKIIATPVNLLMLDEPTNHLDMESCDALLEAIDGFDGAVVMVTHNEMLLHGLAQRLVVFQGGDANVFEGSYQRFLEDRGWEEERSLEPAEAAEGKIDRKADRKALKRQRVELIRERAAALKPLEKRIAELEGTISKAEGELASLYREIESASREGASAAIAELSIKIHDRTREIEASFAELEAASAAYDERRSAFEERMAETGPDGPDGEEGRP